MIKVHLKLNQIELKLIVVLNVVIKCDVKKCYITWILSKNKIISFNTDNNEGYDLDMQIYANGNLFQKKKIK